MRRSRFTPFLVGAPTRILAAVVAVASVTVSGAATGLRPASAQAADARTGATRVDTSFGGGFGVHDLSPLGDEAFGVAAQPDGGVVVVGMTGVDKFTYDPPGDVLIARFTPAGRLDPGFGDGGKVVLGTVETNDGASAVVLQPDGKIVVAAHLAGRPAIVRLTSGGRLDPGFQGGIVTFAEAGYGVASDVAVAPDGRIVFGGTGVTVGRLNVDGTRDPTFGANGVVRQGPDTPLAPVALGTQGDGRVVVGGTVGTGSTSGPVERAAVARYTADGQLDPTFGQNGVATTTFDTVYVDRGAFVEDLVVQPDGRIVVAGSVDVFNLLNRAPVTGGLPSRPPVRRAALRDVALVRYLPDGRPDPAFAGAGKVITRVPGLAGGYQRPEAAVTVEEPSVGRAVALGPDGAIFVAGWTGQPFEQPLVFRYTSSGLLDTTFGREGVLAVDLREPRGWVNAVAVAPDGRLVVAGGSRIGANEPPRQNDLLVGRALPGSSSGRVWTWGWNAVGQLGDGTVADRHLPTEVPGLTGVVSVSAGAYHTLALRGDGTVWSWGWNGLGQLGNGTTTDRRQPGLVPGLTGIVAVSAGGAHSLALRGDGTVWSWGYNGFGQLGDGTTFNRLTPVRVTGLAHATAVSAGLYHSLGLREEGSAWGWGYNAVGQLGDGTTQDRHVPVALPLLDGDYGYYRLSAGALHSMGVGVLRQLSSWGWNAFSQLGTAHPTPPYLSPYPLFAIGASAGWYHSLHTFFDATVYAAGWNGVGQLGSADAPADYSGTTRVTGLTDALSVSAGGLHSLAVTRTRQLWAWGWNPVGQLGTGTTVDARTPVAVPGLSNTTAVSAGLLHSAAIRV